MKKETKGIVLEKKGDLALVRSTAHTGCDGDYCCQGEGVKKVVLEMENTIDADIGEEVVFITMESGMIIAAFILFVLPFFLTFLGAVVGRVIFDYLKINPITGSVVGGILFFLISIAIIKIQDKSASKNPKLMPVIIRNIQ